MDEEQLPVRTQRKLETTRRIHEVASSMALSQGIFATKVEAIAETAGISKRTFFNYFQTKEDAILGVQAPFLPEGVVERFKTRCDDLLTKVVWLFVDVSRTIMVTDSLARHKKLWREFPELASRYKSYMLETEGIVRPVVAEAHPDVSDEDVSVILNLAGAIIRYGHSIDSELADASIDKSLKQFKTTVRKSL